MKYKLILLLILILSLGSINAGIYWEAPLGQVQNVVAINKSGGSITEDTYYIKVCGANFGTYSTYGSTGYYKRGKCSDEVNVTLITGSQTINVTWDSLSGSSYYNVYITDIDNKSNPERWYRTRIDRVSDSNSLRATTDTTSIEISTNTWFSSRNDFDSFAWSKDYVYDGNLDRDLGFGYIHINDSVGDLDLQDIVDVLNSSGATDYYFWDGHYFVLKGGIYIDNNAIGSLQIVGNEILLSQNVMHNKESTDFAVNFSGAIIDVDAWSDRFGQYIHNGNVEKSIIRKRSGIYSHSLVKAGDNRFMFKKGYVSDGGNNVFQNTVYAYVDGSGGDINFTDLTTFSNTLFLSGSNEVTAINPSVGSSLSMTEASSTGIYKVIKGSFGTSDYYGSNLFNVRFRDTINYPVSCVDCDFTTIDADTAESDLKPVIYWSSANAYDNVLNLYNTINLKMIDSGGNALENVNVTMRNINNETVFSTLTDANGTIPEQEALTVRCAYNYSSGGTGIGYDYTNFTNYNTFTLKMEKIGYKTLILPYLEVDTPIDWSFELQDYGRNPSGDSSNITYNETTQTFTIIGENRSVEDLYQYAYENSLYDSNEDQIIQSPEVGTYIIRGNLIIGDGSLITSLISEKEIVYFDDGFWFDLTTNGNIYLGEMIEDYGRDGSYWSVSPPSSAYSGWNEGGFYMYASWLQVRSDGYLVINGDYTDIRNSLISNTGLDTFWRSVSVGGDTSLNLNDVYFFNIHAVEIKDSGDFNNLFIHNTVNGFTSGEYYSNYILENANVGKTNSKKIRMSASGGWQKFTLLNPLIRVLSTDLNIGNDGSYLYEKFSTRIQTLDKNGDFIENANVSLYYNNGSLVFSESTNSSGEITKQDVLTRYFKGTSETETDLNPFNLTISKDNFQIYETQFNITSPIDWKLQLKDYPMIIKGGILINGVEDFPTIIGC